MDDSERKLARRILGRRYNSLCSRCDDLGIPRPERTTYVQGLLGKLEQQGLVCHYCQGPINLHSNKVDFLTALSVDHRIPLTDPDHEPDNSLPNLELCCYRCNLAKGTMSCDTFVRTIAVLRATDPQLLESFLNDSFYAKRANKIERIGAERRQAISDAP